MRRASPWLALVLVACTHDHEHGADHDHEHEAEHGHEHGDGPTIGITRWTDTLELFAEHPPAVVGRAMPFLAHVTVLDGFRALEGARVRLVLEGPAELSAEAEMLRSGIYRPEITPTIAGTYRGRLDVVGGGSIGGFEVIVHPDEASALASVEDEESGGITFLKEQQWRVPFATAFAERSTLRPTVEVAAELTAPPDGIAHVHAPVTGRVMAGASPFPAPGRTVEAGEELATLAPTPGAPEQATRAELDVVGAEARVEAARAELARAERLLADRAVPERRVAEAQRSLRVAEAEVSAAQRARSLYSAASRGRGRGSWRVTSPIAGVIDSVSVSPGEAVDANEPLFRVIDASRRWLVARVPESWATRIRPAEGVTFHLLGEETWRPIGGGLVDVSRAVDPVSRTVSVTWSLTEAAPELRVGAAARVAIPVGDAVEAVVVPRAALVDAEGRDLVYVQVEGERFEERAVRTGATDGARVAILEGVEAGDRVVTRGGYLVRLASRTGVVGHGHVH